jgi:type IV secretion system protein VirB11
MAADMTSFWLLDDIAAPLAPVFAREDVSDICINGPGEAWLECGGSWERFRCDVALCEDWIAAFSRGVASWMSASLNERNPILSGHMPTGERVQIVMPPAAEAPSITIRRPSHVRLGLDDLAGFGAFEPIATRDEEAAHHRATVRSHFAGVRLGDSGAVAAFLREIVQHRLNVIISGATGSGKTTLSKAMIAEVPASERLITIEDAKELEFPHENAVRLFFSRDGAGVSPATVKDLLVSCLRMRPDRIMLAELRDDEAYYYLRNVNSGHPGSITTVHANTAAAAVEQLMLMVRQSPAGAGLAREDIRRLVHNLVDVIIQMDKKKVTEIYILPEAGQC